MGGARLLVCLQDVASLGHTAHSFRHICVLHQLTAHTDVSVSVRHCAHSGDTRLSKAPFLAARAQTISGKNRYMVVMVTQLYKLKTIELHNLDW